MSAFRKVAIFLLTLLLISCSNKSFESKIQETSEKTPTAQPTPTDVVCEEYFESIHPTIIVKEGAKTGVRSLILKKHEDCPIASFENLDFKIKIENTYLEIAIDLKEEIFQNLKGQSSFVRLDLNRFDIPETDTLQVVVEDQNGKSLFSADVFNLLITGIFHIPDFVNTSTGVKNPDVLNTYELRVYHVDSIPQEDGIVSSSFNIDDVQDYKDPCGKPDGIHPEFIHWNAIDYGRCEWGPGSTIYEVYYTGPYPMIVRDIDITDNVGIGVTFDFDFDLISNPPLFAIESQDGNLKFYYFVLKYYHLVELNVDVGEKINPGTMIGTIGQFKHSTELHEERGLSKTKYGEVLYPERIQPIPYKLTLSVEDGQWIEGLINTFNNQ